MTEIVGGVPMATERSEMMRPRCDWHLGIASPVWLGDCPHPLYPCVNGYRACLLAGECLRRKGIVP